MMKIKVCGIREIENLDFLVNSEVDFIGFIFYNQSKRDFKHGSLLVKHLLNCSKKKIGVFVNEQFETVLDLCEKYKLDGVQLHGDESPDYCLNLRKRFSNDKTLIFKAFPVSDRLSEDMLSYDSIIDYFLLDTKGKSYGGNGIQFDWSILKNYECNTPFILSGGIGPDEVDDILRINHSKLYAIDVNSRFEIEPGYKSNELLSDFINEIKK